MTKAGGLLEKAKGDETIALKKALFALNLVVIYSAKQANPLAAFTYDEWKKGTARALKL